MNGHFAPLFTAAIVSYACFGQPVAAQQVTIKETPSAATAHPYSVMAANPAAARAHYRRACALQGNGKIDECILEFQQSIHLDMPDPAGTAHNPVQTADAYRQLGIIRQAKNQLISAVANYRASLRLEPNDVVTLVNLGDALNDRELHSSALTEYQTALRLDPKGIQIDIEGVHISIGNCLDDLNQQVAAVHEFRTAVRLSPNEYTAHYDLGRELNVLGRFPEALREMREAIRLRPHDAQSHDALGWILYDSGRQEEGRIEWRKVLRMGDPNEADAAREELADHPE